MPRLMISFCILLGLAACGNRGEDFALTRLHHTGQGPDEFAIVPNLPLQTPENMTSLPPPTPGSANRADKNPRADGVAALGGNPAALASTDLPAADSALLGYTGRFGLTAGIRQTLRAEDEQIRRSHGRVNVFNIGRNQDYENAYRDQWLDPYFEFRRLRQAGVRLPSAPPDPN